MAVASRQQHIPAKEGTVRASVTFLTKIYAELDRIAEKKKVSLVWVVREAGERYIVEQHPNFSRS